VFHLALRNILLRSDSAVELSQCDVASTISKASRYSTPHADVNDVEQQVQPLREPLPVHKQQQGVQRQPVEPLSVLNMLGSSFVVCEGLQVALAQALRAAIDVMLPLAMYNTPSYVIGVIVLAGLAGSVLGPLLLECAMERFSGLSTRSTLTCSMLVMTAAAPMVLLAHKYTVVIALVLFVVGFSHSCSEALAFKHLVDFTHCSSMPSLCNSMYVYAVFQVTGFTVGSLAAGLPEQGKLLHMQLVAAAIAVGCASYTLAHCLVLKLRYVRGAYEVLL
jgi:hypothetical protein